MYEYFDEMYLACPDESLEHHGILGQKWGIRRFQNYDGTLKAAGKKRLEEVSSRVKSALKGGGSKAETSKDTPKMTKEERAADRAKRREERKAEKLKAQEEENLKKAEEEAKNLRQDIDKAIADVDIDEILRLKGSMTTEELQNVAKRAQALGTVGENLGKFERQLGTKKSKLDKFNDAVAAGTNTINTGKGLLDSLSNVHKSLNSFKEEFGIGKKKDEGDQNTQNSKKNNSNQNNQNNDQFNKVLNSVKSEIASLKKDMKAAGVNQKNEKQPKENQNQQKKKGLLDLWEDDKDPLKSGGITESWSAPNLTSKVASGAAKIGLSTIPKATRENTSYSSKLKSIGQIFSDSNSSSSSEKAHYDFTGTRRVESNSVSNLLKGARETAISKINQRNASGWTAKNNDDWLSVLSTASTMKLTDGAWNKYNKYG